MNSETLQQHSFLLGGCVVDPGEGTVTAGETVHRLQPKVMDVLTCLASKHGMIVSKESLLEDLWTGRFVVDGVLRRCIFQIRKAFDDDVNAPEILETLPRRGYRLLVAPEPLEPVVQTATVDVKFVGSPFRGLSTFESDHSDIFFGRESGVREVEHALEQQLAAGRGFVLMLGPSGCGKSSLARAGIFPRLLDRGRLGSTGRRHSAIYQLSLSPTNPLRLLAKVIADAVLEDTASPALVDDLAEWLKSDVSRAIGWLIDRLGSSDEPDAGRLVLLLDQFEELFSYANVDDVCLEQLIAAIYALARSGIVWILCVMRSEFYPRYMGYEALRFLKAPAGQVDINFPTAAQFSEIVRRPAQIAGLRFGTAPNDRSLDEILIDSATSQPGSLPLLEFALEELYQRRASDGLLTHTALEELGGLEGCLSQRAEMAFGSASADARAALPRVLERLVTVDSGSSSRIARRAAEVESFADDRAARELLEVMTEARLFSSHLDRETGRPVVQVTHEAVLTNWPRARDWSVANYAAIRFHRWLNEAAERWAAEDRQRAYLLRPGKPLIEAERLLRSGTTTTTIERDFVGESVRYANRHQRLRTAAVSALATLTVVATILATVAYQQWRRAELREQLATVEAERADATADFMVSLFAAADPSVTRGEVVTAADLLEQGRLRIEGSLDIAPETKAALLRSMAEAYAYLGKFAAAEQVVQSALPLLEQIESPTSSVPAQVYLEMAGVLREKGETDAALEFAQRALAAANDSSNEWYTADCENFIGRIHLTTGQYAEAAEAFESAKRHFDNSAGRDFALQAHIYINNGVAQARLGRLDVARTEFETGRSIISEHRLEQTHANGFLLHNLAGLASRQGQLEQAVQFYADAIRVRTELYGPDHPDIAISLLNMGTLELRLQRLQDARDSFERGHAIASANPEFDKLVGTFLKAKLVLGRTLTGSFDAATEAMAFETQETLEAKYGPDARVTLEALAGRGLARLGRGDDAAGLEDLRVARAGLQAVDDPIPAVLEAIELALRR